VRVVPEAEYPLAVSTASRTRFLAACAASFLPSLQGDRLDRAALETAEELTEDLANRLLDLSVAARRGVDPEWAGYFSAALEATPMPESPAAPKPRVGWILEREWSIPAPFSALPRSDYFSSWERFLSRFSEVEDVRFKVRSSSVEPRGRRAAANLGFFLVGRDEEGRREWVRGSASASAARGEEGEWVLDRIVFERLDSLVASEDLFSEVSDAAGVGGVDPPFFDQPGEGYVWRGAAACDVDRDGRLDIFAAGVDRNRLFLNRGDGQFVGVGEAALLARFPERGVQPLFLDAEGDGDADLFVASVGKQMLFENRLVPDGRLEFWDASTRSGVAVPAVGFSAAAADVNRDGLPDVYVCSYNRYGEVLPDDWSDATNGTPNLLFLNEGGGRFRECAREWGVADSRWSYATAFADVDEDGDPDLYVANDYGENGLYLNEGSRFVEAARERGVLDPGNGMGVSFGDFDNDGDLDLHVTNMSSTAGNRILGRLFPGADRGRHRLKKLASGNTLFENLGGGRFRDVTDSAGLFPGGWAWGGGFFDFDNDGWEDLFTPNGFLSGSSMADT
jgi:hypothetical protein